MIRLRSSLKTALGDVLTVTHGSRDTPNLAPNPGFEDGLTGWGEDSRGGVATKTEIVTTDVYAGSQALSVAVTEPVATTGDNYAGRRTTRIMLPSLESDYTFSTYANRVSGTVEVRLIVVWFDSAGTRISAPEVRLAPAADNVYARYEHTVARPSGATSYMIILRAHAGTTGDYGEIIFDNVQFEAGASASAYNDGTKTVQVSVVDAGVGDDTPLPAIIFQGEFGNTDASNIGGDGAENESWVDIHIVAVDGPEWDAPRLLEDVHVALEAAVRAVQSNVGDSYFTLTSSHRDFPPRQSEAGPFWYTRYVMVRGVNLETY